jgi:hypothetical protein
MNTKLFVLFLFVSSFFIQGCIPSLHPLYTKDKLVFIEDLLGIWTNSDMPLEEKKLEITLNDEEKNLPELWSFEKADDDYYKLIHVDLNGRAARFDVHVVQLGENYFIDFFREDPNKKDLEKYNFAFQGDQINDMEAFHLMPVHTFAKLEITDSHVNISMFDHEFLEKLFKEKRIRLKHENVDDTIVLTAQPEELQQFMMKYGDDEDAFLDPTTLHRKF